MQCGKQQRHGPRVARTRFGQGKELCSCRRRLDRFSFLYLFFIYVVDVADDSSGIADGYARREEREPILQSVAHPKARLFRERESRDIVRKLFLADQTHEQQRRIRVSYLMIYYVIIRVLTMKKFYIRHLTRRRWLDDLVADDPKVTYNVASNKVIVPMSLLSSPYFETGYPE